MVLLLILLVLIQRIIASVANIAALKSKKGFILLCIDCLMLLHEPVIKTCIHCYLILIKIFQAIIVCLELLI